MDLSLEYDFRHALAAHQHGKVRKQVEIMGQHFFGQLNLKWGV